MGRRALFIGLGAALLSAAFVTAHSQTVSDSPPIKSRTDLVLVPVVVRDKEGRHISGLHAQDFIIEENGKQQSIASLDEIAPVESIPGPPTELKSDIQRGVAFTNQFSDPSQPRRLTIFAMDLVNAPFVDTEAGRKAILAFVESHMSSKRSMGLVAIQPGRVRLLHDFTTSPGVLKTALQKVSSLSPRQPSAEEQTQALRLAYIESERITRFINEQRREAYETFAGSITAIQNQNIASTLESLRLIARWVAGVPGRKELIWMTGDIPFVTGGRRMALGKLDQENYDATMRALADANVAVYPVDVRGAIPPALDKPYYVDPNWQQTKTMKEAMDGTPAGIARRSESLQTGVVHFENAHEVMNSFAGATGGRAYYNRNDIPRVLDDAADDSAQYYMLSYYLDRNAKPGWHKLKVMVNRDATTARARNGFVVPKGDQKEKEADAARKADEQLAINSPFDYTGLPITLRWGETTARGSKKNVAFQISIAADAALPVEGQNTLNMDFVAAASGSTGETAGNSSRAFHATLEPEQLKKLKTYGLTYVSNIELPPGEYTLRVVVRDNLNGRLGSITAPLDVKQ